MTKEELLDELFHHSYIVLKPSPIAGIGIFVVKDIIKGCRDMFSKPTDTDNWITLTKDEVKDLPAHAQDLVENYCLYDKEKFYVPGTGFKKLDVSLFLNHSDTPNIISVNEGEYFEAVRDIRAGEELLIDYGQIVEDE